MTEVLSPADQGSEELRPEYLKFKDIQLPPKNIDIVFPSLLPEKLENPESSAKLSIMLGICADRELLAQPIGSDSLFVKVKDTAEYNLYSPADPEYKYGIQLGFRIAPNLTRMIAQSASIDIGYGNSFNREQLKVEEDKVHKWLLRSLDLLTRHLEEDFLELRVNDQRELISPEGIFLTWISMGYPVPILRKNEIPSQGKEEMLIDIPIKNDSRIAQGFRI